MLVLVSVTSCRPAPIRLGRLPQRPAVPPAAAVVNPHRCDQRVAILGDSRIAEQATVIPRTSDAVVARVLGVPGQRRADGTRDHVEIYAAPGTVHAQHADAMRAFVARCSVGERPLVIDLLGTNYLYEWAGRMDDPAIWADIRAEVDGFYAAEAPRALVVLEELHLDTTKVSGTDRTLVEAFRDGYNDRVLRPLAAFRPGRYLYVPAPLAVAGGSITFRDVLHPTSAPLLAFYEGGLSVADRDAARTLDGTASAAIARADSACAVLSLPAFARDVNGQTRMLIAQLAATAPSRNPRVAAWLRARASAPFRLSLAPVTESCGAELAAAP